MPIIKWASLMGKIFVSGQKTSKKRVFWGFLDKTPGKSFAILLYGSNDARIYRIDVYLDAQNVPTIKRAVL